METLEPFFLGYGVLGVMFVLVLIGWLRPKWDTDAKDKRIEKQEAVIESLSASLKSLADSYEKRDRRSS